MKKPKELGLYELSLEEKRMIEGGAFNVRPMHIYIPRTPEIRPWNPIRLNRMILWS